jgi:hypothetical protein
LFWFSVTVLIVVLPSQRSICSLGHRSRAAIPGTVSRPPLLLKYALGRGEGVVAPTMYDCRDRSERRHGQRKADAEDEHRRHTSVTYDMCIATEQALEAPAALRRSQIFSNLTSVYPETDSTALTIPS